MAQFEKRFHGRHHVPGQLISAEELLEMQYLQYKTYCNVEADRYGLNPDGSFTPHVISGLAPSVVAGAHQIKIGRGQGFATASIFDHERVALVLEEDLLVDLPAPNATHPYWCHVYLQAEPYTDPETYGSVPVGYKGTDDIIRTITTPLYFKMRTTVANTLSGTAAASPVCEIMGSPHQLPIATVLINPGDTGAIPAGQLYDVRWFAPGHGNYSGIRYPSSNSLGISWPTIYNGHNMTKQSTGVYKAQVGIPNRAVFVLLPDVFPICTIGSNGDSIDKFRVITAIYSGYPNLDQPRTSWNITVGTSASGASQDLATGESFDFCINFVPNLY